MILLDGKLTASEITEKLKTHCSKYKIKLVVILVGNNDSSQIYVNMKKKKCEELNIECEIVKFEDNVKQEVIISKIHQLNKDKNVTGILVQLPLPKQVSSRAILDSVSRLKDVDGLNSYYLMKILLDEEEMIPCTPKGIFMLLNKYNIQIEGKKITIIGFSDVVGKPLATMCINRGATVTVCHNKTKNLKESTIDADIVMTATGVPKLITEDMIKENAVVVDIGISRVDNKVIGDVDFEHVRDKCSYITPVPGGVGAMTIISLIDNLLILKKVQLNYFCGISTGKTGFSSFL